MAAKNPYLDETLMNAYVTFSPSEHSQYLQSTGVSSTTQPLNTSHAANAHYLPSQHYHAHHANSQQDGGGVIDEHVIGMPWGGTQDEEPLSFDQLSQLNENDILWMLEEAGGEDDDFNEQAWSRVAFVRAEAAGFMVRNSANEEVFYQCMDDEDMPVLFKDKSNEHYQQQRQQDLEQQRNGNDSENEAQRNYTLSDFDYAPSSHIFVYDDANNFVFYTIEEYDSETTKATLRDNSGGVKRVYLKQFKHENANSKSKKLAIKKTANTQQQQQQRQKAARGGRDERLGKYMEIDSAVFQTVTGTPNTQQQQQRQQKAARGGRDERLGKYMEIDSAVFQHCHWSWVQRTNSMKLKWISYKNTLLGTIAGGTAHLYPIRLDYKDLMFISGLGLGFHWVDFAYLHRDGDDDDDEEEEEEEDEKRNSSSQQDIIEQHLKLFLGDPQLDAVLQQIGKYTSYKFERHEMCEILSDDTSSSKARLDELERSVVKAIDSGICSISNDENGHLALIVGYTVKPPLLNAAASSSWWSTTKYFFKLKKFGVFDLSKTNKEEAEREEYIAIDLLHQSFVITMQPPAKEKKYSLQHSFSPLKAIDSGICSISNDENGHLALIVGYTVKPPLLNAADSSSSRSTTKYFFKLKKFGVFDLSKTNKEEAEREEYIAIDLLHQSFVITMQPPAKEKKYSLQHSFSPHTLKDIVSDLIRTCKRLDAESAHNLAEIEQFGICDLFGKHALIKFRDEMQKGKTQKTVSEKLAKLTIFSLIRLFDARKTSIDFVDYILAKINNAFQSKSGSEEEWKFTDKEVDIAVELNAMKAALKTETDAIRRQQHLFESYILHYDGKALPKIEWEAHHRASLKAALDEIIEQENVIFKNLNCMLKKLQKYNSSK
eukprot:CAMPEP_0197072696 /NCGR_PEP_ID=MMETSP1384-20130603/210226_1 /TAXON_ID=29189 /ORGANISM="Ammonia sp." /LENGTH=882 /DNA_ID=CAMNT_0042511517 /DNA_START=33 /DNA_END=2683 /DNA_ORIENTATION=-